MVDSVILEDVLASLDRVGDTWLSSFFVDDIVEKFIVVAAAICLGAAGTAAISDILHSQGIEVGFGELILIAGGLSSIILLVIYLFSKIKF